MTGRGNFDERSPNSDSDPMYNSTLDLPTRIWTNLIKLDWLKMCTNTMQLVLQIEICMWPLDKRPMIHPYQAGTCFLSHCLSLRRQHTSSWFSSTGLSHFFMPVRPKSSFSSSFSSCFEKKKKNEDETRRKRWPTGWRQSFEFISTAKFELSFQVDSSFAFFFFAFFTFFFERSNRDCDVTLHIVRLLELLHSTAQSRNFKTSSSSFQTSLSFTICSFCTIFIRNR